MLAEAVGDVLRDAERVEERGALEEHADLAADLAVFAIGEAGELAPGEGDRARVRVEEADAPESALAPAGLATTLVPHADLPEALRPGGERLPRVGDAGGFGGRDLPAVPEIGFTAVQFAVVAVLAAIGSTLTETTTPGGLTGAALDILYVGLLSSALTFTLLTVALQYTPPSEAAVIVSMETVFAALAAYLMLGERLSAVGWLGAALILGATLLLQIGPVIGVRLGWAGPRLGPKRRP